MAVGVSLDDLDDLNVVVGGRKMPSGDGPALSLPLFLLGGE